MEKSKPIEIIINDDDEIVEEESFTTDFTEGQQGINLSDSFMNT